jgi:hypothetical protein
VLREAVAARQSILTYYDGSDEAAATLGMAVQLARRDGPRPLTVLFPPEADADRLREEVRTRHGASDVPLRAHVLTPAETRRLSAFTQRNGGLVVLPAGCTPLSHVSLKQFLYEIDRPLLLMR